MATAQSIVRNLVKITIQLKRKIGAIPVEPKQRNTYFTILKQSKTQESTPLTSQSHKTSMVESTYTTVSRNSANVSLMTNLRVTTSLLIIARDTTATSF